MHIHIHLLKCECGVHPVLFHPCFPHFAKISLSHYTNLFCFPKQRHNTLSISSHKCSIGSFIFFQWWPYAVFVSSKIFNDECLCCAPEVCWTGQWKWCLPTTCTTSKCVCNTKHQKTNHWGKGCAQGTFSYLISSMLTVSTWRNY